MNKPVTLFLILFYLVHQASAQRDFSDSEVTKVVLLGTGSPNPSPGNSGCSIAVVVKGEAYIVDFGPGLIRRAASMSPAYGGSVSGLAVSKIRRAFLTHLHSDHTAGYADLILTPWVMGRNEPLEVWGPEGIEEMTSHILSAYIEDIRYRVYGDEPGNDRGWRVNCHEITSEGEVYSDENIRVEAFPVLHGTWPNAWGFRFTTPDKTIVISGDTRPSEKVTEYSMNADILLHEVYSVKGFNQKSDEWKKYHAAHHTSTVELGEIASKTNPRLIVFYHILDWGSTEDEMLGEIGQTYGGRVIAGRDLDIY
ncbi:MAG: MBL fold metallo-hydrolase [Bacteroidales bacterium]|nr:MBL fold metallo-hydrolase [Bacteroidales bacterium]